MSMMANNSMMKKGFSIVELLIIVAVIAIISGIIIVSYNAARQNADRSAAAAALQQAYDELRLWSLEHNGANPASLEAAGVKLPTNATLSYWLYDNNTKYCISAKGSGEAAYYRLSDASGSPNEGACDEIGWVAGEPVGLLDTPNTIRDINEFTVTDGVTLYTVVEFYNTDGNYSKSASLLHASSSNRIMLDVTAPGTTGVRYRIDSPLQSNLTSAQNDSRTPGLHIGWVVVRNSSTVREFAYDKTSPHTSLSLTAGTEFIFDQLQLYSVSSSQRPVATVAYASPHDQATRAKVMNWLAKKYSVPLSF